jgi:hypothetical protein
MAIKFSEFTVGSTTSDIDYLVGYKSTNNVQIPIGLVTTNTTYTVATAQSGLNETLTLTGSDASTDVITFTAGNNITLTDDGAGNGFTIQAKGNVDGTGTANAITKWADADTITDSIMSETAAGGQFTDPYITVAGAGGGLSTQNLEINGFLLDSNGQKGTAGQILSSTGTLTDWITPAVGETYDLNSTTDGANVDLNLTSTSGTDNSSVKLVPATGVSIAQVAGVVTITNTEPNATHTGDVTGATALTIANDAVTTDKIINDAVTADKLADSINSEIAANTAKVTNATHTGEVTGATALTIASDVVDADNLKVTGNGTAGQALLSDGDGTFSWGSAGNTYTAGDGITLNTLEFDLDADLTTVTSIHNTGLKIGRGASDDYISFATDNQISSFIGNAEKMRLDSSFDLQVAGDVVAASTAFSDERLKENIKKIENPLEAVSKLNGVTYDWKANGKSSVGVIAQDVQKVFPELVKEVQPLEGDEKRLTVNYDGLIGVLIESVKELQAEVETLKNK